MHEASRSEPLRWLFERRDSGAFRIEVTGFGMNMLTGNYSFTSLILIDDPAWWRTFGHLVAGNWEAMRLRRYSTRDTTGLATLAADPAWSTEGLFAYLQGLQRLAEIGDKNRLALPRIGPKPGS